MFKLVIIPQNDGTLYVDSLDSYYSQGEVFDVTRYVDFEKHTVNRGKLLNEIKLKFAEPQTIVAKQFLDVNKRGYGDSEVILREDPTDPTSPILDGEKLEFELPFEQVLFERLPNLQTNQLTKHQYGAIIDEESETIKPKPFLFYNLTVGDASNRIGFFANGVKEQIVDAINMPFHHYAITNPNYALMFEAEFSTYTGIKQFKNLYSNHYEDYILSIFNIKRRNWVYKAVLPLHIITKLSLNDTLYIKGNYYRIDKYTHNLLTGETTLNLFNNFETAIGDPRAIQNTIYTDWTAKTETIQVTNLVGSSISYVDTGFGTTWASATSTNNNLSVTFDSYPEINGTQRSMIVRINGVSSYVDVYIYQTDKGYLPSFDFSNPNNSQNIGLITLKT